MPDLNLGVPIGTVAAISGDLIPSGWVVCDGNNGTPNFLHYSQYSDTPTQNSQRYITLRYIQKVKDLIEEQDREDQENYYELINTQSKFKMLIHG